MDGNAAAAQAGVKAAIAEGIAPEVILKEGLISAMGEVGRLFEENEYFVPEMLVSARAMQSGLALLKPLSGRRRCSLGRQGHCRHRN